MHAKGDGECIADQHGHWPQWATRAGANVFFLDYPGYASSDGEPTNSACCQAATAALGHLLSRPEPDLTGVVVAGRSVGSIFALHAAAQAASSPRVRGLLLESGIADLRPRLDLRVDLVEERQQDGLAEVQGLLDAYRRLGGHAGPLLDQLHPIQKAAHDGDGHRAAPLRGLPGLPLSQRPADAPDRLTPLRGVQPPALEAAKVDGRFQQCLIRILAPTNPAGRFPLGIACLRRCANESDVDLSDHTRHNGRQGAVQLREQQVVGAWSDPTFPRRFYKTPKNPHTTALAVWALAEYAGACPF